MLGLIPLGVNPLGVSTNSSQEIFMPCNMTAITLPRSAMTKDGSTYYGGDVPVVGALRAFPNAEGFASLARGAAGYSGTQTVRKVTNLNDSGAGSLRDALVGDGTPNDRDGTFVVFEVSGLIVLQSSLIVRSSYISVFGQTSPNGICLVGYPVQIGYGAFSLTEHYSNVLIRHIRHRAGSGISGVPQPQDSDQETFTVWGADDVYLDHLSMAWAGDEVASVTEFGSGSTPHSYANKRVTFNKCIIADGIRDAAEGESSHNLGLFLGFRGGSGERSSVNIHKTYFAGLNYRTPYASYYDGGIGDLETTNNAVWNWGGGHSPNRVYLDGTGRVTGDVKINFEGNVGRAGANSNTYTPNPNTGVGGGNFASSEARVWNADGSVTDFPDDTIYHHDNLGVARTAATDEQWSVLEHEYISGEIADDRIQALTKWDFSEHGPIATVEDLGPTDVTAYAWVENTLLPDVGATRVAGPDGLGATLRDTVDQAIIAKWGTTSNYLSANDLTWPTSWDDLSVGADAPQTDTSGDGIPDSWGAANIPGYDINTQYHDEGPTGDYTWLEKYSHVVAGDV